MLAGCICPGSISGTAVICFAWCMATSDWYGNTPVPDLPFADVVASASICAGNSIAWDFPSIIGASLLQAILMALHQCCLVPFCITIQRAKDSILELAAAYLVLEGLLASWTNAR